jgi:glycosyltransferase involved in cell wall biosynthesis
MVTRIAIDISAFPVGGQERQVAQLARGLALEGDSVLLLINKRGRAFRDILSHPGIKVVELERMSRYDVRVLWDIARRLHSFRAQVLLCVGYNATLWGRIAAIALGTPVLTAEHQSVRAFRRCDIDLANWVLGPFTSAVVACASAQQPYLVAERNPVGKIVVIRNGVDPIVFRPEEERRALLRRAWGVPDEATLVGIVAAHRAEKRHDRFIRLVETCSAEGADVYGVMVGGGELLETNRNAASASPSAGRMVVAGPVSDMPSAYCACDIVVLMSDIEVFPLSFLEAQACSVPVVGFDLCGVRETMRDGVTGYLVPRDDEAGMARRVLELSRDPVLRQSMGAAGRAWVSEVLTIDSLVAAYETLLERVAGEGLRASPWRSVVNEDTDADGAGVTDRLCPREQSPGSHGGGK